MKLKKIATRPEDPVEGLYCVKNISATDIDPAGGEFLNFVRGLSGFSFLSTFTVDEFNVQVQRRFVSKENE